MPQIYSATRQKTRPKPLDSSSGAAGRTLTAQQLVSWFRKSHPESVLTRLFSTVELQWFVEMPDVREALQKLEKLESSDGNYDLICASVRAFESLVTRYECERASFSIALRTTDDEAARRPARRELVRDQEAEAALKTLVQAGCREAILVSLLEIYRRATRDLPVHAERLRTLADRWSALREETRTEMERVHADGYSYFEEWPNLHNEALAFEEHLRALAPRFDGRRLSRKDRARSAVLFYVQDTCGRPHYEELAILFRALGDETVTAPSLTQWRYRNRLIPPMLWIRESERASNQAQPGVHLLLEPKT